MAEYGKNDAPSVLDNNPDINNYKEIKPDEKISFDECDKIWKDLFSVDKLEELFDELLPPKPKSEEDPFAFMRPPFMKLTMDDAFLRYAGFKLSDCDETAELAKHAKNLGLEESTDNPFETWPWDDLYELILVSCIEPNLPKNVPVMLMDYPAKVPCLAQEFYKDGMFWKERWEL